MNQSQITQEAKRIARETGQNCYILNAPCYTDDHEEGPYVAGTIGACNILFRPIAGHPEMRKVVGVVGPKDEHVFWNDLGMTMRETLTDK